MSEPTSETSIKPTDALTAEYASQLLFQSFYFSQGDNNLQENMFKYLHLLHPSWKMSDSLFRETIQKTQEKVAGFFSAEAKKSLVLHDVEAKSQLSDGGAKPTVRHDDSSLLFNT